METNKYKLFINQDDYSNIELVKMPAGENYYDFIEQQSRLNKEQFLLTSRLMIAFMLRVLKDPDNCVNNIELYDVEDIMAHDRIMNFLNQYRNQQMDEKTLHDLLFFIENDYSVDFASVEYSNIENGNFTIQSNGVCILSGNEPYWLDTIRDSLKEAWE
ncbi:hypothetical protein EFM21_08630 [Leuconostoc falkenbergense]|uniref:hypothetical protein n=1 Tax=Leuconostoc falkenbergense TaxID=2766470 RepID=UPI0021A9EF47|nr:hypothetical protein [Leuconostoc falkenbergense]MCT4379205.1 hypothetical protein [Leuconostoc falkenbergense]